MGIKEKIEAQKKVMFTEAIEKYKKTGKGLSPILKKIKNDILDMQKEGLSATEQSEILVKIFGIKIKNDSYRKWQKRHIETEPQPKKIEENPYPKKEIEAKIEPKIEEKIEESELPEQEMILRMSLEKRTELFQAEKQIRMDIESKRRNEFKARMANGERIGHEISYDEFKEWEKLDDFDFGQKKYADLHEKYNVPFR